MGSPTDQISRIKAGLDILERVRVLYERYFRKLPNGEEKAEGERLLHDAGEQLKIAKAQIAQGLGYILCHRHFPPGIMVRDPGTSVRWRCLDCKQ